MNSHDRRTFFRHWRANHQKEVDAIIAFIASKRKHFVMSHISSSGVIEMREDTSFTTLNMTKNKEGWREFLREKGVIDIVA